MSKYECELDLETDNSLSLIVRRIKEGSKILEFGPAAGRLTKHLKEGMNCQVYIVELDGEAYKKAILYAEDGVVGDIETYEWHEKFKNEKFDYILFADVLEHLRNPKKVIKVCREHLCENGRIITSIPNVAHNSVIFNLLKNSFRYNNLGLLDNTHIHLFTYNSVREMFEENGMFISYFDGTYIDEVAGEFPHSIKEADSVQSQTLCEHPYGEVYQFIAEAVNSSEGKECEHRIRKFLPNRLCTVYFDNGNGYNEDNVKRYYYDEENRISIVLERGRDYDEKTLRVRFDPYEGRAVRVSGFKVSDESGNAVEYICNGEIFSEGIIFGTTDPAIEFAINGAVNVKIEAQLFVLADTQTVERMQKWISKREEIINNQAEELLIKDNRINELCAEINSLRGKIESRQQIIDSMKNSTSWKVTKPIRTVKDAFKK